ncbi:MAG: hypothetical protein U0M23_06670 [Acutalibacteraceae bacterium]|nr:hypothetical protein [Acutalibacteraceae bacterium]
MAETIMQDKKECYITKRTDNLHRHHIYGGAGRRKLSEQYGCWVWLTGEWHNQSNHGVHFNPSLDLWLKQQCQKKMEKQYTRQEFICIFGRSYL